MLILPKSDTHHIRDVLRLKKHELVQVTFEKSDYICMLGNLKSGNYFTHIKKTINKSIESTVSFTAVIALQKANNLKNTVLKLTELGVERILIYFSENSVPLWKKNEIKKKIDRLNLIINSALKQSHQRIIPELLFVNNIFEFLNKNEHEKLTILCNEKLITVNTELIAKKICWKVKNDKSFANVTYIIGPEGGFTEAEIRTYRNLDCWEWKFSNAILKCDTAAITALILLARILDKWK